MSNEGKILWQDKDSRIRRGVAGMLLYDRLVDGPDGTKIWKGTLTTVNITIRALETMAAQQDEAKRFEKVVARLANAIVDQLDSKPEEKTVIRSMNVIDQLQAIAIVLSGVCKPTKAKE